MADATNLEVQFIDDLENATEFQLKHTPSVQISGPIINVSIGLQGLSHPQTEEHFIEYIALMAGNKLVEKIEFDFEQAPVAVFALPETDETLVVQALCNLHGLFGAYI
jgi:superoxide reductase